MDSELQAEQAIQPIETHRNDLLKIVALVTMLIDHVGYLFFPEQMLYRTIGRIAFPIFAYQVALGFQKTSNRKAYAGRLLAFAIVSQIPYVWFNPDLAFEFDRLNIMFTLLVSLGVMFSFEKIKAHVQGFKQSLGGHHLLCLIMWLAAFVAMIALPEVGVYNFNFGIEYGSVGLLLVLMFYIFGKKFWSMLIGYVVISAVGAYDSAVRRYCYSSSKPWLSCFLDFQSIWKITMVYNHSLNDLSGVFFQSRSVMAVPIIAICNWIDGLGRINIRLNKYVGYLFYPVHITLLLLIKYYLF